MEMYKNFRDKPYLIMIGFFTISLTILSLFVFTGDFFTTLIQTHNMPTFLTVFLIILLVFTFLGILVFALLYPFHLLNLDYKNKVMSLMFASGVSRTKYYFVKIGATILTCYLATAVIALPLMLSTESGEILAFMMRNILAIVQWVVVMMVAIILTKGSVAGLFLFIGLNLAISIIHLTIRLVVFPSQVFTLYDGFTSGIGTYLMTFITIVIFGFLGILLLRRQDL
jgi:hypothetical protein